MITRRKIPRYYILIAFIFAIIISCQDNKTTNSDNEEYYEEINPRHLMVHNEDLSVLFALQNDTLYRALEDSLIQVKGMSLIEAEETIQLMMDNNLIMNPSLGYYDEEGRQFKELKYKAFKYYIAIIKDSVQEKEVKLDSSNFPYPKKYP